MLVYDAALLSEHERHIYRNNISINMVGGVRQCIPNDNLVEIMVHRVKECMRAMGANVTYEAAWRSAKCLGMVIKMIDALASITSGDHSASNNEKDVSCMVDVLANAEVFKHTAGRKHATFPNMGSDY